MSESDRTPLPFTISLESPEYDPEDSEWQDECRQFYNSLVQELEEGRFEPLRQQSPQGDKADFIELFNHIITYGISIGAFSGLYQLAQLWLEQRNTCDVVLKFPDGSVLNMRGLSWKEAEQKMQEHQQRKETE